MSVIFERLSALRSQMAHQNIDAFIIPRSDEHQGEYVAPCSERLLWLTGFSGSAGYAIVSRDKAALFVDGRYTLQAPQETDTEHVECRHVVDDPASDWLRENLKEGDVLGFDPWLHTKGGLHRFETALKKVGAEAKPVLENCVDAVWKDRPVPPMDQVILHPMEYAGQSFEDKLAKIGDQLKGADQDYQILVLPDSIAWLCNIRGSDIPHIPVTLCFAIVSKEGKAELFISKNKLPQEVRKVLESHVIFHEPDMFKKRLEALGAEKATVRLDETHCPVSIITILTDAGAIVQNGEDLCLKPKACKNEVERQGMRNAHHNDGIAMVRFLHWLSNQPNGGELDEWNVAAKLDGLRAEHNDFRDYSFPTISGAGSNGAVVHYRVSEESSLPLPKDGLYLVDSGAQYPYGTTDITRTISRGTPTPEMKKRYTQVLKGHIALARQQFPKGTTGSQLDTLARMFLWQDGVDFDHGTGHGVGSFLSVHEGPQRISKMPSNVVLKAGMVISNEPGFYKDNEYGIRIENLVMVQDVPSEDPDARPMLAFETLSLCPFDKTAMEIKMLSDEEINWINSYHSKIFDAIGSELDEDVKDWLAEATSSL